MWNLFDKTIKNIKNTQTLCFIVIVMISLFLISYLACEQNYRKKNSLPPPSAKKKDDKKKYNVTDYLELKIPVSCLHFFYLLWNKLIFNLLNNKQKMSEKVVAGSGNLSVFCCTIISYRRQVSQLHVYFPLH